MAPLNNRPGKVDFYSGHMIGSGRNINMLRRSNRPRIGGGRTYAVSCNCDCYSGRCC